MSTRVIATCPNCNHQYVVWIPDRGEDLKFYEKCRQCDKAVQWLTKQIGENDPVEI